VIRRALASPAGGERLRLFVALLLEPVLLKAASEQRAHLASLDTTRAVRWVEPGGLHLTLKFLGEVDAERLEAIRRAIATAAVHPAPRLGLAGCGAFPNAARPRVIWLGLAGDLERLGEIQQHVEAALEPLGWSPESRPFAAHVTVGRCRDAARLAPALLRPLQKGNAAARSQPEVQTRLALMQSHLERSGARYEEMAVWRLGSPSPA
jgi:2'-5' RNA ligase